MQIVVRELIALRADVGTPSLREKVAAAGFLMQFYNGVENILKRISKDRGVALPEERRWHVELFEFLCIPGARVRKRAACAVRRRAGSRDGEVPELPAHHPRRLRSRSELGDDVGRHWVSFSST